MPVMQSYVQAELAAASSSINTALIKLRRLAESEEIDEEEPARKTALRGLITKLDNVQKEVDAI